MTKYARKINSPRFGWVWQVRFRGKKGMPTYYSDNGIEWWVWDFDSSEKKRAYPHCTIKNPKTDEIMYSLHKYD